MQAGGGEGLVHLADGLLAGSEALSEFAAFEIVAVVG